MGKQHTVEERLQQAQEQGILVDEQDVWLLADYTWHVSSDGYAATNVVIEYGGEGTRRRKYTLLHHCIVGQPVQPWEEIDHINFNRLDDRRNNLRYVTKSEQNINTSRATGASGARNISLVGDRYAVLIRRDGVRHYLGTYDTLDEAVATREEWLYVTR